MQPKKKSYTAYITRFIKTEMHSLFVCISFGRWFTISGVQFKIIITIAYKSIKTNFYRKQVSISNLFRCIFCIVSSFALLMYGFVSVCLMKTNVVNLIKISFAWKCTSPRILNLLTLAKNELFHLVTLYLNFLVRLRDTTTTYNIS